MPEKADRQALKKLRSEILVAGQATVSTPTSGGNGFSYSGFVNGESSAVLGGILASFSKFRDRFEMKR